MLPEGTYTASDLSAFVGRNLLITPMDGIENIIKMNKMAGITEMVISLNELNNSDNLEDGKVSNVLLRHHINSFEELMNFEPVSPQYKKLKDVEFTSLTLRIRNQSITDGSGMTVVLHIVSYFKMEYRNKLNQERFLRTTRGIKGTRQKVIVTHNPSEINQNQLLLVRFPNLGSYDIIIPGTANLSFSSI